MMRSRIRWTGMLLALGALSTMGCGPDHADGTPEPGTAEPGTAEPGVPDGGLQYRGDGPLQPSPDDGRAAQDSGASARDGTVPIAEDSGPPAPDGAAGEDSGLPASDGAAAEDSGPLGPDGSPDGAQPPMEAGPGGVCTPGESSPCVTPHPGICGLGERICAPDGYWADCLPEVFPGAQPEGVQAGTCNNALDDDCDGKIDDVDDGCRICPPGTARLCPTGLPGRCQKGMQPCTLNNGIWDWESSCAPPVEAETTAVNRCDGEDDDCDGTTDEGTFLSGPVAAMDYLRPATAFELFGRWGRSLLLANWHPERSNHYAAYQLEPAPAAGMIEVGADAAAWLRQLVTSSDTQPFITSQQMAAVDALMLVPAGTFIGLGSGTPEETLLIFSGSTVKKIELASKRGTTVTLASLGIPDGAGGVIDDYITAATLISKNAVPGLADDVALVTRGGQVWGFNSHGWVGPLALRDLLCPPGSTGCPANLEGLSALTSYADETSSAALGMTIGSLLHYAALKTDGQGQLVLDWTSAPLSAMSCEH